MGEDGMIVLGLTGVTSVRHAFANEYDRMGGEGMIDLQGVSFIADEESIFGEVNQDYVERELEWYLSRSLKVADIPGGAPKIWRDVADQWGWVNSNYGYLLFSPDNFSQFDRVVSELKRDPDSRRAVAIYTRPTMHTDSVANGMQDFVCTNTVAYRITDGAVDAFVNMRSNDAVFGYRNDLAWQQYALQRVADEVGFTPRHIIWQAASLHVYPRHHNLIAHYAATGEWDVPINIGKEAAA